MKPNLSAILPPHLKANFQKLAEDLNLSLTSLLIYAMTATLEMDRKQLEADVELKLHSAVAEMINVMRKDGMNMSAVARELGISRTTLYKLLKQPV